MCLDGWIEKRLTEACRRDGDSVPEAVDEVQGWTMALYQRAIRLQIPMASLHHHLLSVRSVHLDTRPTGG